MKILFCFLFITIFVFSNSYSQNYWIPTGTMSSGNTDWVYSITSNSQGELFASSWAVGIYKSTDGTHWNFSGLNGKRVSYLTVAPNGDIYALSKTVNFSYIHRSTDNGNTWHDVYTGSFSLNYAAGGAIVFPADSSIVAAFAVTVGPTIGDVATFIFKSTDGGNNWIQRQVIGLGFVGGMITTADNKILLGTSLGGVYYSANNGNNFAHLNTFPSVFIETIIKAPDNTIYVSDAFGLNRSTDNGNTFENAGNQNSTAYLRAAGVTSTGELFISMDDRKIFHSTDRGNNWIQINNGIPDNTYAYTFASAGERMFAGTNNSGVFYFRDHITNVSLTNENAEEFRLDQNFPNPFNPRSIINYSIPSKVKGQMSNVKLAVYDILGNEVVTLVNERQSAGSYRAEFDGSNYSSGTYFYELSVNGYTETKKMLLMK